MQLLTQIAPSWRGRKNLPMHIHLAETKAQAVMARQHLIRPHRCCKHLDSLGVAPGANLSLRAFDLD